MKIVEDADDDREHAEAFREGGEDDREAADLTGRVGVSTDRAARHAGQDADADAGSDDAQGREARAEMFHWFHSSYVPGQWPGV